VVIGIEGACQSEVREPRLMQELKEVKR